jgi:hypothetical protein
VEHVISPSPAVRVRAGRGFGRAAAVTVGLLLILVGLFAYRQFDFKVFWEAGRDLLHGDRIYPSRAELGENTRSYFVYPPFVAMAFVPFAVLPFGASAVLYVALAIAATVATLRILGVEDRRCYLALLFWMPVLQSVGLGTIAPFLGLALAVAWTQRHSRYAMPVCLALAVAAKLFLWPVAFWLLATKRWRAAATWIVATAFVVFVPWAVLGFRDLGWYPHALRLLLDHEQSLGFSTSVALGAIHLGPATIVVQAIAVASVFWLARRPDGDRRAFSAAIVAALVLSPLLWIHYFALLVVPVALARRSFSWLWVAPALAFWPPPNNLGHPAVAVAVFAVLTLTATLTLREA